MYQSESPNNYYLSTMSMNIDDVNNILDKVIDQSFTRYQIMKLGYKDNLYITEEQKAKFNELGITEESAIAYSKVKNIDEILKVTAEAMIKAKQKKINK